MTEHNVRTMETTQTVAATGAVRRVVVVWIDEALTCCETQGHVWRAGTVPAVVDVSGGGRSWGIIPTQCGGCGSLVAPLFAVLDDPTPGEVAEVVADMGDQWEDIQVEAVRGRELDLRASHDGIVADIRWLLPGIVAEAGYDADDVAAALVERLPDLYHDLWDRTDETTVEVSETVVTVETGWTDASGDWHRVAEDWIDLGVTR